MPQNKRITGTPMRYALSLLTCVVCTHAYAINPPQWMEFSNGKFIDTGNVKNDGSTVSAYVRSVSAHKEVITLYEVDCRADKIRTHSDFPRYISIPVKGGGSVVQIDDGFRTVTPGSQSADIEMAMCGIVAQQEREQAKQSQQEQCERAKQDEYRRVMLAQSRLTVDEAMCLMALADGRHVVECDKAAIPQNANVTLYLQGKGIFLECEAHSQGSP